jgi:hypothetical protein
MQLVNHTAVPAKATVARVHGVDHRVGIATAKATFRFAPGRTDIDGQAPVEISRTPKSTPWGELPPDLLPRDDDRFEVIVLGCAHAPEGETVTSRRVAVSVGSVRNELCVFGDRTWISGGDVISDPVPFASMPLSWARAFGGSCEIEMDVGAKLTVCHPFNPAGRGFDGAREARAQHQALGAPPGFPRFEYRRMLPNVEYPQRLITSPEDAPPPACWATLPADSVLRIEALSGESRELPADPLAAWRNGAISYAMTSAREEWTIDRPPSGALVTLEGLLPEQHMSFPLPELRVVADYVVGSRTGSIELRPQMLILLCEERRLVVVYHALFRVEYHPEEERGMRIRLEQGWYG